VSFRLPGWGGCCIPNPWRGTAAPALPGRPASHSRFATAIAKETHHQRACLWGFLTWEGVGVNQKSTILRNYPIYADESMRAITYPGFPELYLPGTSGRTASADSGSWHLGHGVVGIFGKTAGEEDWQSRHVLEKLRGSRGSAHVGHHYVQYCQVGTLEFRKTQRLTPVGCGEHLVAQPRQRLPRQLADRVVILGQQDSFRACRFFDFATLTNSRVDSAMATSITGR